VRHCYAAKRDISHKRLDVGEFIAAGCRVPYVTDRNITRESSKVIAAKNVCYEPKPLVNVKVRTIGTVSFARDNPGTLLAPVLLSIETKIGEVGSLSVPPHPHEATFIVKLVEGRIDGKLHGAPIH
jgi:hypothetical protein